MTGIVFFCHLDDNGSTGTGVIVYCVGIVSTGTDLGNFLLRKLISLAGGGDKINKVRCEIVAILPSRSVKSK